MVLILDKETNLTYKYEPVKHYLIGGGVVSFEIENGDYIECDTIGLKYIDDFFIRYSRFCLIATKY